MPPPFARGSLPGRSCSAALPLTSPPLSARLLACGGWGPTARPVNGVLPSCSLPASRHGAGCLRIC
eukprot:8863954-Alexandrium_andersonii.AAC.1